MWIHCPRASNGLLPRRSNLVGYVRRDARSDRFPPCQTIIPTAFRSQSGNATYRPSRIGIRTDSCSKISCPSRQQVTSERAAIREQRQWSRSTIARPVDFSSVQTLLAFLGPDSGEDSTKLSRQSLLRREINEHDVGIFAQPVEYDPAAIGGDIKGSHRGGIIKLGQTPRAHSAYVE
jgi:hypothetical protein